MREGSGCPSVTSQGFPSLRATKTIAEVLLKQRGKGRKEMVEQQVPGFGAGGGGAAMCTVVDPRQPRHARETVCGALCLGEAAAEVPVGGWGCGSPDVVSVGLLWF